ncbi:MAG TPA: hypothetical protein VLW50_20875, partial [Streptosporangiaceae bacterium]|nr:hypothetical protein [Streptosporangiaceae bacterium]
PLGFGAGGCVGGLGAGGLLLRSPGLFFRVGGKLAALIAVGLGGADPSVGLGACLLDRSVPVGRGGGDPRGSIPAGLGNRGVPFALGYRAAGLRLVHAGLGGGELRCQLFRRRVGFGAELALLGGPLLSGGRPRFGGHSTLLSGGPHGLELHLGGGWVSNGGHATLGGGPSNGRAEALNAQVNALITRARGFRSATALMNMILFVHGGICPDSPYA